MCQLLLNPILLAPKHTTAVSYLIKPKNSISNGISIKNKASIKFDYNEPIITNNTQTRISIITGLQNKKTTTNFELHPNPANNEIYIEFINTDIVNYLQIFDIQGNVLNKLDLKSNKSINIDVRNYPNGVYFINFIDKNNQSSSVKFVITR
ncbi:MAG: T9SS type A sorting domain-containing protein [Saprospirales bacterium]|nr:T9SS type A sorting domain-containing protein [Saprospirales bacterium]